MEWNHNLEVRLLRKQGESFTLLDILTTDWLRGMAAFNLRKCYAAFMECRESGRYSAAALDLSIRWAALDRRLEATAEKIEKIKAGKVRIGLSEKDSAGGPRQENSGTGEKQPAALPVKGTALPIDKAAVRKAGQQQAAEETLPEQEAVSEPEYSKHDMSENNLIETPEEKEDDFKRYVLLQEAVDREDMDAFETAERARGPALEALWESFIKRDAAAGFAFLKRMGAVIESAEPPPEEEFAEICEPELA